MLGRLEGPLGGMTPGPPQTWRQALEELRLPGETAMERVGYGLTHPSQMVMQALRGVGALFQKADPAGSAGLLNPMARWIAVDQAGIEALRALRLREPRLHEWIAQHPQTVTVRGVPGRASHFAERGGISLGQGSLSERVGHVLGSPALPERIRSAMHQESLHALDYLTSGVQMEAGKTLLPLRASQRFIEEYLERWYPDPRKWPAEIFAAPSRTTRTGAEGAAARRLVADPEFQRAWQAIYERLLGHRS